MYKEFCLIFLETKKVLIIITDGHGGQVDGPARQLKNSGVVIFAVGVGSYVSMHDLYQMASQPVHKHVVQLGSFSQLSSLSKTISEGACKGKPSLMSSIFGFSRTALFNYCFSNVVSTSINHRCINIVLQTFNQRQSMNVFTLNQR